MTQDEFQNERSRKKMWQEVDLFLEEYYPHGCHAGKELEKAKMETSQIRGLESLIVSTRRFSEVLNYIKNQAGKGTSKSKKWRQVAGTLIQQLQELETKGAEVGAGDPALVLEAKLRLVRGWGKQVVTHYLFEKSKPEIEG